MNPSEGTPCSLLFPTPKVTFKTEINKLTHINRITEALNLRVTPLTDTDMFIYLEHLIEVSEINRMPSHFSSQALKHQNMQALKHQNMAYELRLSL
jgi:hypothetical protein